MVDVCNVDDELRECDRPKFHVRDGSMLGRDARWSTVVSVDPGVFLKAVTGKEDPSKYEFKAAGGHFNNAEDVNEAFCDGEPVDVPYIMYDVDNKRVIGHEGRMRSYVAKQSGMNKMPLKIFCHNEDRQKKPCEFDTYIHRELKNDAESQFDIDSPERRRRAREFEQECEMDDGL